ncbi:MAG: hypothetical protein WCK89_06815 [bacterium]
MNVSNGILTVRLALTSVTLLTLFVSAQSINVGPNGTRSSDDARTVLAPEPIKVDKELTMAELPVAMSPATFFLNVGTSGRYGPYALTDGTVVGSAQAAYTLRMVDSGQRFTLQSARDTALYGPFAVTNGAPVTLGNTVMTVVRVPPHVAVSLSHPNKINQAPLIGIAPYNTAVIRELYGLRAKYVTLANRMDTDTADMQLAGVPRVSYSYARRSASPVVHTSERDRQNALKGAELSAMVFLEKLFGQAFTLRSQAITDGSTYHFQMPPGDYLLCAMQKVKDPNAASMAGSVTAVWWTPFHFDGEHPLSLALSAENAIIWRDIFKLSRAR